MSAASVAQIIVARAKTLLIISVQMQKEPTIQQKNNANVARIENKTLNTFASSRMSSTCRRALQMLAVNCDFLCARMKCVNGNFYAHLFLKATGTCRIEIKVDVVRNYYDRQ